jgi:hypothetical protein
MAAGAAAVLLLVLAGLAYRSLADRRERPPPETLVTPAPPLPAAAASVRVEVPAPSAPVSLVPDTMAPTRTPPADSSEIPSRPPAKRKREPRTAVPTSTATPHPTGAPGTDDLPDQSRQ